MDDTQDEHQFVADEEAHRIREVAQEDAPDVAVDNRKYLRLFRDRSRDFLRSAMW